jgi:hypothetical protein
VFTVNPLVPLCEGFAGAVVFKVPLVIESPDPISTAPDVPPMELTIEGVPVIPDQGAIAALPLVADEPLFTDDPDNVEYEAVPLCAALPLVTLEPLTIELPLTTELPETVALPLTTEEPLVVALPLVAIICPVPPLWIRPVFVSVPVTVEEPLICAFGTGFVPPAMAIKGSKIEIIKIFMV